MSDKEVFKRANRVTSLDLPEAKRPVPFTQERKEKFLQALAEGYSVAGAAAQAGVSRRSAYHHRDSDTDFASEWDECLEEGTDKFEDRMKELAFEKNGFLPTMATLKARRPSKWADKVPRPAPGSGIQITINIPQIDQLPPALRQMVQQGDIRLLEGDDQP